MERFRIIAVVVPIDIGRCFRSRIIAIHAPPRIRYDRLVKRQRDDAPRNVEEFDARDSREMGWGLANVIALSDHLIVNDGSLEKFREEASAYLRSIA